MPASHHPQGPVPGWSRGALDATRGILRPAVHVCGALPGPRIVIVGDADDPLAAAGLAAFALELDPAEFAGHCALVPACDLRDAATLDAIEERLLEGASLVLEIAVGDPGLHWSSAAIVRLPAGARRGARADVAAEEAMIAFGAPESLRLHVGAESDTDADVPDPADPSAIDRASAPCRRDAPDIDLGTPPPAGGGTLATRAARRGVAHVQVRRDRGGDAVQALKLLRAGCRNVLVGTGALAVPLELRATRHLELGPYGAAPERGGASLESGATVRAGAHGTLAMALAPGADVHAGTVLARLQDPARPGAEPAELLAPRDGTLLACRADGPVAPGERIALIAEEMQP